MSIRMIFFGLLTIVEFTGTASDFNDEFPTHADVVNPHTKWNQQTNIMAMGQY